jgi:hypothetical protein
MLDAKLGLLALIGPVGWILTGLGCGSSQASTRNADAGLAGPDASTLDDTGRDAGRDEGALDVGVGPWTKPPDATAPVPMDDVTVFAFSQTNLDEADPQVVTLAPDMNIRAWQRWDTSGVRSGDYDFAYVSACHAAGVRFIGGTTATALFQDEFPVAEFSEIATRNASGALVAHPAILPNLYRGSLANPAYRAYLVQIGELQIDGGVDGLFFDEINEDYEGAAFDGNEGFDPYHLADFNAYLLWRYPNADYSAMFGMTSSNLLKANVPAGDLGNNFNYQTYLEANGWAGSPFAAENPLAPVWGQTLANRPAPTARDFVDRAEPDRYWPQIASELRAYAKKKYGRNLLLTANGIWPYVDFQAVGLYPFNQDGDGGAEAQYVPATAGSTTTSAHLDGTVSLQSPFLNLKARSAALAPGAPVVLFLDWPTTFMSFYLSMPTREQEDYWRIYAAEAYANGLFFSLFLMDTVNDPTATQLGLMPFFQTLAAFYRTHANLYHGVAPSTAVVTTSLPSASVMVAVSDQAEPKRRLVHLVNHDYAAGLVEQDNVAIFVSLPNAPSAVTLASPDAANDTALSFSYVNGNASTTLPTLEAYDVVAIAY